MANANSKEKDTIDESEERLWARARGKALLENLDFVDVVSNVKANLIRLAADFEVDSDELINWYMAQMPLTEE